MPQDRANCVPNAVLAQIKHLSKNVRAINVRACMVIELLLHEETIWVQEYFIFSICKYMQK